MRWSERACIVHASYQSIDTIPPRTVVELFCRAEAGHSITLLVTNLRPFLEIALPGSPDSLPDIESLLDAVRSEEEVVSIAPPIDKWTEHGTKPHWRVEVTQPYVVPRLRRRLAERWEVSSADIVFPQRLLLDADLGPHIGYDATVLAAGLRAPEEIRAVLTDADGGPSGIEAAERIRDVGGSGLYPTDLVAVCSIDELRSVEPFAAPFVTLSFDLETRVKGDEILCAAVVVDRAGERQEHALQGEESELLASLTRIVRESDPDIVTGYNIDNFDLPRIEMRQRALASSNDPWRAAELFGWGRTPMVEGGEKRTLPNRQQNRRWRMPGRCVMDAWWEARMSLRPRRESLRFVSEMLFPEREELRKLDIDASRMDEEWANRPEEVLRYCVRDTVLPLEILDAIQATARKEALASVSRVPLETAIGGTTSQWLDSLVIRLADRESVAVPMTKGGPRSRDQIAGGYVHEVEPGIHPWVAVLDFKSMYPSIMIANNICSTTRIDQSAITEYEVHESPMGTRFIAREGRAGLVPRLLEDLMAQRDRQKAALAECRASGDEAGVLFHDSLQFAIKILMNSFYGVFASSFYRFTHPDLGASITAWARSNIRELIETLESEGHPIVYSDTDSIFVRAPVADDAPIRIDEDSDRSGYDSAFAVMTKFGSDIAQRFSIEGAELEFETGLSAFFSHGAKKRYVGRVVWPEERMLIRGYEVRRTDSFDLLTEAMTTLFDLILNGESDASVRSVLDLIARVRARDVEPRDLVISRSCKGHVDKQGKVDFTRAYDHPERLPYVRAARKRIAAGLAFTPGMKIGYLVTDRSTSPMTVEPWLVEETGVNQDKFDPEFYAERIATALGRLTEAFGWRADDLLKGKRQTTLFSF